MLFFRKKENITNDNNDIPEMDPNVKFNMETVLDYYPKCTTAGKKKLVEIVTEYAQINYNFEVKENLTDIDTIFNCFLLFNENDSYLVRHKVHQLTYSLEYYTEDLSEQRREAANEIRKMFPEYDMEYAIESILPGYGNIQD